MARGSGASGRSDVRHFFFASTVRPPDDGAREPGAAVARLERLRSRGAPTVAEVVVLGVNHHATPDEITQAHVGDLDVDSYRSGRVGLDVAQVPGVALPLLRSAVSRSSGVVVGAGSLAGVASDVSALMDVQAVVSGRHALQPHSDEHAPAKLREAHAALDAVHREDGQRLPRRGRLAHLLGVEN